MAPKEVRKLAGKSLAWCAAMSNVSYPTAVKYELSADAVMPAQREKLDRFYAELRERVALKAAAEPAKLAAAG